MEVTRIQKAEKLLEKHSLRKTPIKKEILGALLQSKRPLSQAELLSALSERLESVDRVSVYRNINQMKDVGLVHEVDMNSYVCCSHECDEHPHLLFFCQSCHRHQEVKDHGQIDGLMKTLGGFGFFGIDKPLFIKGVCSGCRT